MFGQRGVGMIKCPTMTFALLTTAKTFFSDHREGVLAALNWAALLLVGPIMCAAVAEYLSLSGVSDLEEGFFLMNVFIYLFAHLVVYLFTRNTRVTCIAVFAVVLGFSIANHYVIKFTGIPITFGDLMSAGVGIAVAGGYTYTIDPPVAHCLFAALIYGALVVAVPKSRIRVNFRSNQVALAVVAVATVGMGGTFTAMKTRGIASIPTNGTRLIRTSTLVSPPAWHRMFDGGSGRLRHRGAVANRRSIGRHARERGTWLSD